MNKRLPGMSKPILMIGGLAIMLAVVIYAMQYTRGEEFKNSLSLFFGQVPAGKTWLWCPRDAESLSWNSEQPVIKVELVQICAVEIEPANETPGDDRTFKPLVTVNSPSGIKILESNASLELFQIEGLPFKSQKLTEFLKSRFPKSDSK